MLNRTAVAMLAVLSSGTAPAADMLLFHYSKIVDKKQRQVHADLIFNRDARSMVVRVADNTFADVPYAAIGKLSYQYSKRHRVTEGALVMVAWIPAGAIVMLTKSRNHWLYVDYKQDGVPKELVVRLHKREYKDVLAVAKRETGIEVENMADALH